MPTTIAQRRLDTLTTVTDARARLWRPFPRQVADVLCVDSAVAEMRPRIHSRFAIALVRSPSVVRVEASSSLVVDRPSILLVPAWQLFALRVDRGVDEAGVTLLLDASRAGGLAVIDCPSLIDDAEAGAQLAALLAQLRRPVRAVECETAGRSLVERLALRGRPVPPARKRSVPSPLVAIRNHLRVNQGSPVSIAEMVRLSGLSEYHLIRAFHHVFGLPPHAYHLRLRLALACDLLERGLSVSAVAYESGFADQSHLSRKFKAVYGLTPASWAEAAGTRERKVVPLVAHPGDSARRSAWQA
ncbi:MAG TPA: AraC family transcriptional regulator [Gemmatimonadaceae bacterium]|nr:AraC family transcriptional regulator [Gemmatimonadaceae bacterium]